MTEFKQLIPTTLTVPGCNIHASDLVSVPSTALPSRSPCHDLHVLRAMISPHPTRDAMTTSAIEEEAEDGVRAVVRVDFDGSDKARVTIHETVDDGLPPNQP